MSYSLAIFDLDGTLADSFPWFLTHLNDIADRYRFRRVADDDVARLRHADARDILESLGVARWKVPLIARHMRKLKTEHLDKISLFPGVAQVLKELKDSGVILALVSSDTEKNARQQLGPEISALFSYFACGASLHGKPKKIRSVLRSSKALPQHVISIGDELRDIEAARAAGISCAAVTWGFAATEALKARQPDYIFDNLDAIPTALVSLSSARHS